MTPIPVAAPVVETVSTASAIVTILQALGSSNLFWIVVVIIAAPWITLVFVSIAQHRRFEAVVTMYNNNFQQVEVTQNLAKDYRELITWTTSEVTKARKSAESNMHCPIVRKNSKPQDIHNV